VKLRAEQLATGRFGGLAAPQVQVVVPRCKQRMTTAVGRRLTHVKTFWYVHVPPRLIA
jgi:hypothetical protein